MSALVSPEAKFSICVSNGSPYSRRRMAARLNDAFFLRLCPKIEDNKVSLSDFEHTFHSVMPERVNVDVEGIYTNEFSPVLGSSDYNCHKKKIVGQTIEVSANRGKVKTRMLPIALHESRHVIDSLCNPKYMAREMTMRKRGLYTFELSELHNNDLYCYEFSNTLQSKANRLMRIREHVLDVLDGLSVKDQINCIQSKRYMLESEYNAYGDTAKYAAELRRRGFDIKESHLMDQRKMYMFAEKIELLKMIGFDIIKDERERMAARRAARANSLPHKMLKFLGRAFKSLRG